MTRREFEQLSAAAGRRPMTPREEETHTGLLAALDAAR